MNPESIGLKMCDKSFTSLSGSSPHYIEAMLKYCTQNSIELIIPCSDEELIPLSRHKQAFERSGCKILSSSEETLQTVLNKPKLFKFCIDNGMCDYIPNFYRCKNKNQLLSAYNQLAEKGFNVCVKPAKAHGSRGFRVISDKPLSMHDFFNKKPDIHSISIGDLCKTLTCDFPELMVMEYLSGVEYSVDCFARKEDFLCVPRTREVIKDGICVSGVVTKNEELIAVSKKLYKKLGLKYNANLQFRYDDGGNPKLLEINPRFSGTMEHCRAAGVNFVEVALHEILGMEHISYRVNWGTRMVRVWKELFTDSDRIFTI